MSTSSRKFQVPDQLANLYDFANSLDVRHFTHHGVQHVQDDELKDPGELGAWMAERGLLAGKIKITPAIFGAALRLRTSIRVYLESDPADRYKNKDAVRSLNEAIKPFPLVVEARRD